MPKHEPCDKDEVFLGNTQVDGKSLQWLRENGLKTLRLGRIAYDIYGNPLSESEGCYPLFIKKHEHQLYDDIMMEKTFGRNWRRQSRN